MIKLTDEFLNQHLDAWLLNDNSRSSNLKREDIAKGKELIWSFIKRHPKILEKESWNVIYQLALKEQKMQQEKKP